MESLYLRNLKSAVLKYSDSSNWNAAVYEWEIYDVDEDDTLSESCVCGKENLRYLFTIKNKINGIGRIFPTALIRIPFHIVTSSNDDARIPPRSSRIGNSEIINTIASLEICAPKVLVNQVTRLSI